MDEQLLVSTEISLPTEIEIKNARLYTKGIDLLKLARDYGTPLRYTYLPSIADKVTQMIGYFQTAFQEYDYRGRYSYYYCTKSSHFRHVLQHVLQAGAYIEISSAYDIALVQSLIDDHTINADMQVICNGYKTALYQDGIIGLINAGKVKVVPILDSQSELYGYIQGVTISQMELGIRINLSELIADLNLSRFGLSPADIIRLYKKEIAPSQDVQITTLHFFYEKGIEDQDRYWDILEDVVSFYCQFSQINPDLHTLDLGGGMPFRSKVDDDFNIQFWVWRIVSTIQRICRRYKVDDPNIITEFGKYTVAEASGTLFKILEYKMLQSQDWAIVDGSFITQLPDSWAIQQTYPIVPVNNLDAPRRPFVLGGLTCDSADRYPAVENADKVMLPCDKDDQYIAVLHTGAYQESLSGFGGVNHCLIPSPRHIIIDRDDDDHLRYTIFAEKQSSTNLLKILGY